MHQTPPPVCHACIEAQAKDLWQKSINDKLGRLAESCDKISEKVNYQERRMMYGGQGARIEEVFRQIENGFYEWDLSLNKDYFYGLVIENFTKYVSASDGVIRPSKAVWK